MSAIPSASVIAIATPSVTEKKVRASPHTRTTLDRSTTHNFFKRAVAFETTTDSQTRTLVVEALEFPIRINRPGSVKASASARASFYREDGDPGPPGRPFTTGTAILAIVLLDPDGQPRDAVTMADLNRDRDARGVIHPRVWTLKIPVQEFDDIARFTSPMTVVLKVVEAERPSLSASPLLRRTGVLRQALAEEFRFDLYRLGRLTAALSGPANGVSMTLMDPAGNVVATGANGRLTADIQPQHLKGERPGSTRPPLWKLKLSRPASVTPPAQGWTLLADVHGTLRIPASVLQSRLNTLLGSPANPNLTAAFERYGDTHKNRLGLTLKDGALAETLGIHNALKGLDLDLNPGADLYDYQVGRKYVLLESQIDGDAGPGGVIDWWLEAKNLQTTFISLRLGESSRSPGLPAILLEARTTGSLEVHIDLLPNAHFTLPVVSGELAFRVEGGRIQAEHWINPASIQGDGVVGKALLALLAVKEKLKIQYSEIDSIVERIFGFFMGGRFTFTAARWAGNAFEFDYVAGVEMSRAPRPGYMPRGSPAGARLPNWTSPNLSKVDHIVVLMMENRSFDHMLGSLALTNPNVDGITPAVVQRFNAPGHSIRSLAGAAFPVITQFPLSVGHKHVDVSQQLTGEMRGFVANFKSIHEQADLDAARCKADDVLGYYPIGMLPTYEFLAREYAVCDRFFCSHPGPTLPNRMYSLTGELQRTMYGEPRYENGVDRNMTLSRELTIFDILNRFGIAWHQYESLPSVAMLRYFARYAGDDHSISDIRQLKDDVRNNRLLSVTFIDPQMHASPQNDDSAPGNLLHGQQLVRDVYDALTSNPAVWSKTLLVVCYDEHGGFFDHVVPATAEALPKRGAETIVVNYGVRVPAFLVSPWVPRGGVVKQSLDFTSILKTILVRFCAPHKPFLSDRVSWADDLGPALSLTQPRPLPANPPPIQLAEADRAAATAPSVGRVNVPMSELTHEDADWHDFMGVLGRAVQR